MKDWKVQALNKENAMQIAENYQLPILIAMLLDIRGISCEEDILEFIEQDNELTDPFLMADMDKAVLRIGQAIQNGEKICIYGDYDADGVTSTALLYEYLSKQEANVIYYIPSREQEGYGLNKGAIDKIKSYEITLIITVDNGISALEEIDYANELGMDVVVTDHHKPLEVLPNAAAVVNPHRADCPSTFKELAGVGVAFKLIMAMEDDCLDMEKLFSVYGGVAALGTIGDVVTLTGENRVIVKNGLESIKQQSRIGINALMKNASITSSKLTAGRLSFTVVPRINAGGRLGLSEKSVKLLLSQNKEEAQLIAEELGEDNKERQTIEREITKKIITYLSENPECTVGPIIVVNGENWHQGVIGIVAARIKELYGKPTLVISYFGEEAKGSGRSIKGFSLVDAVMHCSDLLTHYGGHPMAAGLSLKTENIDAFAKKINEYAKAQENMPFAALEIDCKLNPAQLSVSMAKQITMLEPFGSGNPSPLFGLYNMTLSGIQPVGGGNHLRLTFSRETTKITAMLFGKRTEEFPYKTNDILDLAVTIDINEYNNQESLSVVIRDLKYNHANTQEILQSNRLYEYLTLYPNELSKDKKAELYPEREEFALIYRFLKQENGWAFPAEILYGKLHSEKISYGKMMVILTAMRQLGIVNIKLNEGNLIIDMCAVDKKVDLQQAPIIKQLL